MRELKGEWKDLFNGFMLALDLRKMFLGLCGVVLTLLLGALIMYLGNKLDPQYVEKPASLTPHAIQTSICQALHVIYSGTYNGVDGYKPDPLVYIPLSVGAILLILYIWSYFGGAIARIAAYEVAKDERVETSKALKFSNKKFSALFWAPLICVIGFLFFYLCNVIGGGIGWVLDLIRIGGPLVAIFLPLAILSGFIMVLILIGTLASITLFQPAIGAEGTDGFDAVSRGFSYIFSKPWHYIWYQLTASVYGVICVVFIFLFAVGMCTLALDAGEKLYPQFKDINDFALSSVVSEKHSRIYYKWDAESLVRQPHPYGRTMTVANEIISPKYVNFNSLRGDHKVAGVIVLAWLLVTLGLAYSYLISYFISSQTIIYFILRKKVDGIEMNEVYEEPEEEEKPSAVTVTPARDEKKEESQTADKKS